jgi:hypothetical protein
MKAPERVLCLDVSTKTGWSLGLASDSDYKLVEYGAIPKVERPELLYPEDYVRWAERCASHVIAMIQKHMPDVIVIEETTSGSKSNFSQKILEFIHFIIARYIVENKLRVRYLMTGEWRSAVGAKMTKEESKKNKERGKIKEKTGLKLAKDGDGKIIGRVTKKHVNVRRANELFGLDLKLKDNDVADSTLLGYAYYMIEWKRYQKNV